MEDWDIDRIIADYVDAAERMKAAGLDGLELQAYGHLMDQFWSPLTNDLDGSYGGSWTIGCASPSTCCAASASAAARISSWACAIPVTRTCRAG